MGKRYLHIAWTFLFFITTFCSCEWEVDLEELRVAPRLVLNSVVTANAPVTASVSRTWFFTEESPNITFTDSEVLLYINNEYRETMVWAEGDDRYNSKGLFKADYCPISGDKIKLVANQKGYPSVSAEVIVPYPCPGLQILEKITDLTYYEDEFSYVDRMLSVTFRDDPAKDNYYLFHAELGLPEWDYDTQEYTGEYTWNSFDYTNEPLFMGQQTALEKILNYDWLSGKYGRVFNDDLINGKEYTIKLPFAARAFDRHYHYNEEGEVVPGIKSDPTLCRVSFYTISESYFRYMKSLIEMEDDSLQRELIRAGLAEPVSFYSNIVNGLGILGGCYKHSVTFELSTME